MTSAQSATSSNSSAPIPSLDDVLRNSALLETLSLSALIALRRQVSHLAADLDAAVCQAMAQAKTCDQPVESPPDRLLTPEAAADRFCVSRRWLLDHADQIAGVRRLSRKIVRFNERQLERFFQQRSV
jgi:hypothetical protein